MVVELSCEKRRRWIESEAAIAKVRVQMTLRKRRCRGDIPFSPEYREIKRMRVQVVLGVSLPGRLDTRLIAVCVLNGELVRRQHVFALT